MISFDNNPEARAAILSSIREHLAASSRHDVVHNEIKASHQTGSNHEGGSSAVITPLPLLDLFIDNLEAADGSCIVANDEVQIVRALKEIISSLKDTPLETHRIALSDAPAVEHLARQIKDQVEEIAVAPRAADLFNYDLGITTAQAAIAETGTLVLDSKCERHRLVSLLPPVHIAIVEANKICLTLAEALLDLRNGGRDISPTVTFVTGPSRTADIELTLAIGVHGPQKLFVIINTGPALETLCK